MLIEIICFLLVSFMLGLTLKNIVFSDFTEEHVAKLLFGVSILPILAIALGYLILASYFILLIACTILMLVFSDYSQNKIPKIICSKEFSIVLGFAVVLFAVFNYGASNQFWLEDGDPNGFAEAISYIAHYHTFLKPSNMFVTRYMEPYPVGFQSVLGIVAGITMDVNGTMKALNSLLICLSIPAFYLLMRGLGFKKGACVGGCFILLCIPSFSTRFIFAQSLAMIQMLMGFYFLSKTPSEVHAGVYSGLCFGALCITHQTTAVVAVVLAGLWFISDLITHKKLNYVYSITAIICLLIAGVWWGHEYAKYGAEKIKIQLNIERLSETTFGLSDPSLKLYSIIDLVISPTENSIDNMIGFGPGIFLLLILSLFTWFLLHEYKFSNILIFLWLIFLLIALFSNHLPISFIPSRMWPYVSIPVAILTGWILYAIFKDEKYEVLRAISYLFIATILLTSLYPKIILNTSIWGSSRLGSEDEYNMAKFIFDLPKDTKVMDACYYERVWGLNKWDDPLDTFTLWLKNSEILNPTFNGAYGWDSEGWLKLSSKNNSVIYSDAPQGLYNKMSGKYKYVIVGSRCMRMWGVDNVELGVRMGELTSSGGFETAFRSGNEYVLKIK